MLDQTSNYVRFTNEGERIVLGYDLSEDQIERKLSQVKRTADYNFRYHSHLISPKWQELRQQVATRCKNICERCKKSKVQAVHHITYKRLGCERLTDLLGVCNKCHDEIHKNA